MSFQKLYKDLRAVKILPVYLLHGEEPFFIDQAVKVFENELLNESERSFNQSIFYGKDSKAQDIIDTCMRYPMFAERQVVILKEAKQMRDFDKLETYLEKPVPTTVLVIAYKQGKYDARRKLFKNIAKHGEVFLSDVLKEQEVPTFIKAQLQQQKLQASDHAIAILGDHIGTNLSRLVNEIEKLRINLKDNATVTPEDIETYIGISKDFNVFELVNALLERDLSRSLRILHYMLSNPKENPTVVTLANIYAAYAKLYLFFPDGPCNGWSHWKSHGIHASSMPSFNKARKVYSEEEVEHVFSLLLEYYLRSKGMHNGNTDDKGLLTEMIYKLCMGASVAGVS